MYDYERVGQYNWGTIVPYKCVELIKNSEKYKNVCKNWKKKHHIYKLKVLFFKNVLNYVLYLENNVFK